MFLVAAGEVILATLAKTGRISGVTAYERKRPDWKGHFRVSYRLNNIWIGPRKHSLTKLILMEFEDGEESDLSKE